MSQADDGLISFFFYVMFVYPLTNYFLKPGRFPKKRGVAYAIGFLTVLALSKTIYEIRERGPNHYQDLNVRRNSSPLEIKKAYKKMSLELHPDKNKSPTAAEEFARVKDAYDTLMDQELREVYNKFGPEGVKQNRRFDESTLLIEIAIYYATWGMLAFVLTLGKQSSNARNWIFTGQIIMLIAQASLMFQESKNIPDWFLPKWTDHEMILFMQSLFPAFLNGCRCLGGVLYVDQDELMQKRLQALEGQNNDMLAVLRDIQVNIHSIAARRAALAHNSSTTAPSTTLIENDDRGPLVKATPTGLIKEMAERVRLEKERGAGRVSDPVKKSGGQGAEQKGGFGMWWAIALYIIFHFVFPNSSS